MTHIVEMNTMCLDIKLQYTYILKEKKVIFYKKEADLMRQGNLIQYEPHVTKPFIFYVPVSAIYIIS